MTRQYPTGFRNEMVQRMLGGEPVPAIRAETGILEQTLHCWKHQALIDVGPIEGVDSNKSAALRAANRRIKALKKELQLVKGASEIYDSQVVDPKVGRPSRRNSQCAAIREGAQLALPVLPVPHSSIGSILAHRVIGQFAGCSSPMLSAKFTPICAVLMGIAESGQHYGLNPN